MPRRPFVNQPALLCCGFHVFFRFRRKLFQQHQQCVGFKIRRLKIGKLHRPVFVTFLLKMQNKVLVCFQAQACCSLCAGGSMCLCTDGRIPEPEILHRLILLPVAYHHHQVTAAILRTATGKPVNIIICPPSFPVTAEITRLPLTIS
ncbi:hypothetical protein D9M69_570580 [compost metagenome]